MQDYYYECLKRNYYNTLSKKTGTINLSMLMSLLGILIAFNAYVKNDYDTDDDKNKFHKLHHKNLLKVTLFLALEKYKNQKKLDIYKNSSIIGSYSAISSTL